MLADLLEERALSPGEVPPTALWRLPASRVIDHFIKGKPSSTLQLDITQYWQQSAIDFDIGSPIDNDAEQGPLYAIDDGIASECDVDMWPSAQSSLESDSDVTTDDEDDLVAREACIAAEGSIQRSILRESSDRVLPAFSLLDIHKPGIGQRLSEQDSPRTMWRREHCPPRDLPPISLLLDAADGVHGPQRSSHNPFAVWNIAATATAPTSVTRVSGQL